MVSSLLSVGVRINYGEIASSTEANLPVARNFHSAVAKGEAADFFFIPGHERIIFDSNFIYGPASRRDLHSSAGRDFAGSDRLDQLPFLIRGEVSSASTFLRPDIFIVGLPRSFILRLVR